MTLEDTIKYHYTSSAIPDKIKKELVIIKFYIEEYKKEIEKYRKNRSPNQRYYDYESN